MGSSPPASPFRGSPGARAPDFFVPLIRFFGIVRESVAVLWTRSERPTVFRKRRVIEEFLFLRDWPASAYPAPPYTRSKPVRSVRDTARPYETDDG